MRLYIGLAFRKFFRIPRVCEDHSDPRDLVAIYQVSPYLPHYRGKIA
jgi:hypothetical protein